MVGALYREASRYCFMFRIGLLFSARHVQHKTDMVGVQLHKPAAYHLGGLIVPGDVQQLAVGSAGVHQQINDLADDVLVIRAKPEQKVYLQRLRKNIPPVVRAGSSRRFLPNRRDKSHSSQYNSL